MIASLARGLPERPAVIHELLAVRLVYRTAIWNMVRAGIPKQTAMQLSGHRTASVFDRYDIHDLQDLEEATAKLARASAGTELARLSSKGIDLGIG